METPSVPFNVWILAAFDPVLIGVAVTLAWKADQFGKVSIAVIAALAASLLFGSLVHALGLPWLAPVGREVPTLLPVRVVAAAAWACAAYGVKHLARRRG